MKKVKDVFILCAAHIFVGTLSLAGKAYPVRIGRLYFERAHLLVNTDYWLRTHPVHPRGFNLFISGRKPYNRQILRMIKRKIRVIESDFAVKMITAFQKRIPQSDVWIPLNESGHFRWKEWNSAPPQLALNKQEEDQGKSLLKEMGIGENEPIVCFYSRDDKYLGKTIDGYNWGYHNYRNSSIENYLKAMEWLTAKGYRALRMGALVEQPLTTANPMILDYASCFRSDFMDAFLFSYCKFSVGDTAGLISFPNTFNKALVMANSIPFSSVGRNKNALTISKKHRDKRTGKILTFRQIFEKGMERWGVAEHFEKAGIELIENTADEILDVTKEIYLRQEGQWQQTSEDDRLQERFHAIIPAGHLLKGFVGRMGAAFLRNNQELLE